ncbi:hypothetical protein KEK_21630 [Mycolicibacterium thermoresistibile ATCC 19527]|uniref:Uncharacterized protein n=2 Tax=Mycolicibacterium thermoresistibile TaxID=1797 RepID=G7CMS9_MYCT3|nr:hypothetical protein KEK_21630 [Mycolicibacterium thermoresistibile ATCC 19527]GAT16530.1 putative uncharacterized protein [Mycolicibacterium thermoresistibile]
MFTGPVSLALAYSESPPPGRAAGESSPPLAIDTDTTAVTAITASNATPPSAHFQPLPRFFGGIPPDHCNG